MTVYPPNGGFSSVFAFYFYMPRISPARLKPVQQSPDSCVYTPTPFEEFISRVAVSLFFMGF